MRLYKDMSLVITDFQMTDEFIYENVEWMGIKRGQRKRSDNPIIWYI